MNVFSMKPFFHFEKLSSGNGGSDRAASVLVVQPTIEMSIGCTVVSQ